MDELIKLADTVRNELDINFDNDGVKFIEEFIERQKHNFSKEEQNGLVNSLGSFLGQTIINNYGGQWQIDSELQMACVSFDEKNKVYPFSKTLKQFENGLEDSVYSFYQMIPNIYKLDKKSEKINASLKADNKPWWKIW
jgi:hypothetical protein